MFFNVFVVELGVGIVRCLECQGHDFLVAESDSIRLIFSIAVVYCLLLFIFSMVVYLLEGVGVLTSSMNCSNLS